MHEVFLLSLAGASISFTVTETKIFQRLREWGIRKGAFMGQVLSCGYCLGFWVAFFLVAMYRPKLFEFWWPIDYFLTAIIIAWFSAIQWGIMCLLMAKIKK